MSHDYLIIMSDPTVAEDLAEIVGVFDKDATIHVASTIEAAEGWLMSQSALRVALVGNEVAHFAKSTAPGLVVGLGGTIIVLGDEPANRPGVARGWYFVPSPFTTRTVENALSAHLQPI